MSPRRFPVVQVPIEAIVAERRVLAALLREHCIPARDRDDVLQLIILGAWRASEAKRYRPDPAVEPRIALRRWLVGICWRQASHYRESAYVRREVLTENPRAFGAEVTVELDGKLRARAVLRALAELPKQQRDLLVAATDEPSVVAYARRVGANPHTTAHRLHLAREVFALRIARSGL